MALKSFNPITPSTRQLVLVDRSELWKGKPVKALTEGKRKTGDRVAVGLDVRGTVLAARGWTEEGGDLYEVLERLNAAGCSRYVVTDVTKDGMMKGPNLELLRDVCARTDKPVIASGGISSLADIAAIRDLVNIGVEGAILGKALYAGAFTLTEALAVASGK